MATSLLQANNWAINAAISAYFAQQPDKKPLDPKLMQIFEKYTTPESPESIDIDGTLQYLEDLGLDPEDPASLTLSYILGSPQTGVFKKREFCVGWSAVGATTLPGMKKALLAKHTEILADDAEFEKFYTYVFDFIRESDLRVKQILYADATAYWRLLFGAKQIDGVAAQRLEQWYEFLAKINKTVTRDSWRMFLLFFNQVILPDPTKLLAYEELSAWPSLIDEYVEWLQETDAL